MDRCGWGGRVDRLVPIAALSMALLLAPFATAGAQLPDTEAAPPSLESFGFWFAGESLPHALDPVCGDASGRGGSAVLGGFLVIPVGPIGLEARASRHLRQRLGCALALVERNGTFTDRSADVGTGDFTTLDLRLRLAVGQRSQWVLGLGGGWAASQKDVPYLTSSVGLRRGTTVLLGVDLELNSYRVPWTARTAEYDLGRIVNVVSDQPFDEWATSLGLRFTIEIPVSRPR